MVKNPNGVMQHKIVYDSFDTFFCLTIEQNNSSKSLAIAFQYNLHKTDYCTEKKDYLLVRRWPEAFG